MLPTEILENIKEDDVIIYCHRKLPIDLPAYQIGRVLQPRYKEHNCNVITQDSVLIYGYGVVDYSKIVKVCDTNSNVYLLFSYLENLEFELKRAKELQNEYCDKLSTSISPRDDFNNAILNDALIDYILSHENSIRDVKHKIARELNLLQKK
jgi:hypothetical protein